MDTDIAHPTKTTVLLTCRTQGNLLLNISQDVTQLFIGKDSISNTAGKLCSSGVLDHSWLMYPGTSFQIGPSAGKNVNIAAEGSRYCGKIG